MTQVGGADSERELRAIAFGDRPDAEVWAATCHGEPRQRWLAAVALGGQGRYAAAASVLRELITAADPVLAALAGSTLAAHRRQLGCHAVARRLDAAAIGRLATARPRPRQGSIRRDPDCLDANGAWVDALLGLAADAVGLGRVAEARRLRDAALLRVAADPVGRWRARIRLAWVGTEIELAAGAWAAAVRCAERGVRLALSAPSLRHVVKSKLMLSAALTTGGTPDGRRRAQALLDEALRTSLTRGLFPLAWPCALLLVGLVPDRADWHTSIASKALTSVLRASDGEVQRLAASSIWVPIALVRSGEAT